MAKLDHARLGRSVSTLVSRKGQLWADWLADWLKIGRTSLFKVLGYLSSAIGRAKVWDHASGCWRTLLFRKSDRSPLPLDKSGRPRHLRRHCPQKNEGGQFANLNKEELTSTEPSRKTGNSATPSVLAPLPAAAAACHVRKLHSQFSLEAKMGLLIAWVRRISGLGVSPQAACFALQKGLDDIWAAYVAARDSSRGRARRPGILGALAFAEKFLGVREAADSLAPNPRFLFRPKEKPTLPGPPPPPYIPDQTEMAEIEAIAAAFRAAAEAA